MHPKYILLACVGSCLFYMTLFLAVVHKPLTVGASKLYLDQKLTYLQNLQGEKLVVLAGSNGRFSHRCETLEEELNLPCANMSIAAGTSLDYQFEKLQPHLKAGDMIYLPLEYGYYAGSRKGMMSGAELPVIVAYDHNCLFKMDWRRTVHALFYFDLKFLLAGAGEMVLDSAGVKRRFTLDTLTAQGDESTHTLDKGKIYRDYLDSLEWVPPGEEKVDEASYRAGIIKEFLAWATNNHVIVIGGLPATFNDKLVPKVVVEAITNLYVNNGHHFILLPHQSQYPRLHFYDTAYHLAEPYQIEHSRLIASEIAELIESKSK